MRLQGARCRLRKQSITSQQDRESSIDRFANQIAIAEPVPTACNRRIRSDLYALKQRDDW